MQITGYQEQNERMQDERRARKQHTKPAQHCHKTPELAHKKTGHTRTAPEKQVENTELKSHKHLSINLLRVH